MKQKETKVKRVKLGCAMPLRGTGVFMAAVMLFFSLPVNGYALTPSENMSSVERREKESCEHHQEHTQECGYAPAGECTHEHSPECYKIVTECIHTHTEECFQVQEQIREDAENISDEGNTPIMNTTDATEESDIVDTAVAPDGLDAEDREPLSCVHICSAESGCTTEEPDCHHVHDENCGFSEAQPCSFVCEICNSLLEEEDTQDSEAPYTRDSAIDKINALIAALPDEVTEDNRQEVQSKLDEILTLYSELTQEEQEQTDITRCLELQAFLEPSDIPAVISSKITTPLNFTNVGDAAGQTPAAGPGYAWSGNSADGYLLELNGLDMDLSGDTSGSIIAIMVPFDGAVEIQVTGENRIVGFGEYMFGIKADTNDSKDPVIVRGTDRQSSKLIVETGGSPILAGSDLLIQNVTLQATAKQAGVISKFGNITIEAADLQMDVEGIAAACIGTDHGDVAIQDSRLRMNSGGSGMFVEGDITVTDSDIEISAGFNGGIVAAFFLDGNYEPGITPGRAIKFSGNSNISVSGSASYGIYSQGSLLVEAPVHITAKGNAHALAVFEEISLEGTAVTGPADGIIAPLSAGSKVSIVKSAGAAASFAEIGPVELNAVPEQATYPYGSNAKVSITSDFGLTAAVSVFREGELLAEGNLGELISIDTKKLSVGDHTLIAKLQEDKGNVSKEFSFTVTPPPVIPVTGVTLNVITLSMSIGQQSCLTASVEPDTATETGVTWESDNAAVATVSSDGTVTAVGTGSAVITATTVDGGYTAVCTVMVQSPDDGSQGGEEGGSEGNGDDSDNSKTPQESTDADSSGQGESSQDNTDGSDGKNPQAGKRPDNAKTDIPTIHEAEPAKTDKDGNVAVESESIAAAIRQARQDAQKNKKAGNGVGVILPITTAEGQSSFGVTMKSQTLDTLVKEEVRWFEVHINENFSVCLDRDSMKWLDTSAGGGDIILRMSADLPDGLTREVRNMIGDHPVLSLKLVYVSGGKETPVEDMGGHGISVRIKYTQKPDERTGNLQALFVDKDGKVKWLTRSGYNSGRKEMIFIAETLGLYAIGYKNPVPSFTDIKGRPDEEYILFAASRGLLTGTGNKKFSPDAGLTRAMLAAALGRLAEINLADYKNGKFQDVPIKASYAVYANWAAGKGIMNPSTEITFQPEESITREQMALIMKTFADRMGYTVPRILEPADFADSGKISPWAQEAVQAMQQAGILTDKESDLFRPQEIVTRAEAATVLYCFIDAIIDLQPVNGWKR